MRRPRIGITTSDHKSRLAWWCDWLAVWRAGGLPVRLSPSRGSDVPLDGLIVGGGDDIGAQLYGGEMQLDVRVDPQRDTLELALLERVLPTDRPVLGICRGAQIINVFLGGSLITDIHATFEHIRPRRTVLPRKTVRVTPGSRLHQLLGVDSCHVNSLHHQAIDRTGHNVRVVARDRDDLVQGIESTDHDFVIGVQWHPEFLVFNRPQQRLIRALVERAAAREAPRPLSRSDEVL
ncbi:gamma-glutamyl-gamma-aminobutyrate hydrolase family protein [Modicisalibacter sp. 'Wilcox']|uniref:gamma-glutamyl-gamma-aminobutyrate hydrolase family protein n=1 Tax=Modicisalibacter sp. 'Wilcox' TaxID=2679914 RepID=UPI0013D51985|nr:gamma-glutamyl-gamma-aminobutyrate hydrolase family protein [Modicisalibacter sp. 'Wilcox']